MDAEELAEQLVLEIGGKVLSLPGASTAAFFGGMIAEVMAGTNLPEKERIDFEVHAKSFIRNFGRIIRIDRDELQEAALEALLSALFVSAYYAGGPEAWRRLDKARTEPARSARKKDVIQEIIAREAKKLWKRKPSFKNNSLGTAKEICDAVISAIEALPKPPSGWSIAGLSDPKKRKLFIEAIAKRVARISEAG